MQNIREIDFLNIDLLNIEELEELEELEEEPIAYMFPKDIYKTCKIHLNIIMT